MRELVTSKITKVLSECFILRCGKYGFDVVAIAILPDELFDGLLHQKKKKGEMNGEIKQKQVRLSFVVAT